MSTHLCDKRSGGQHSVLRKKDAKGSGFKRSPESAPRMSWARDRPLKESAPAPSCRCSVTTPEPSAARNTSPPPTAPCPGRPPTALLTTTPGSGSRSPAAGGAAPNGLGGPPCIGGAPPTSGRGIASSRPLTCTEGASNSWNAPAHGGLQSRRIGPVSGSDTSLMREPDGWLTVCARRPSPGETCTPRSRSGSQGKTRPREAHP